MNFTLASVVLLGAAIISSGCTDDGRDIPGGGFRAACMVTADCGCTFRTVDDTFCREDGAMQLQCLGGSSPRCSLSCTTDTQCTSAFGSQAACSSFGYCQ